MRTRSQLYWDDFFDPHRMKTWLARNADKSEVGGVPQYDGIASPTAHLEKLLQSFQPKTAFDSPQTQAIFGPILERAKRAAEEINYASSGQSISLHRQASVPRHQCLAIIAFITRCSLPLWVRWHSSTNTNSSPTVLLGCDSSSLMKASKSPTSFWPNL